MRFAVTALALSFALGCGAAPDKDKDKDKKDADPKKLVDPPKGGTVTPPTPEDPKAAAQTFATDFVAAVKAKKATPEMLTADFKKLVAPPFETTDPKGYSDERARNYLDKWAAVTANAPAVAVFGDAAFAAGTAGPGGRILMRLAKEGGAWKADWLSNGPPTAFAVSVSGGEETVAVLFAVAAFTDAALKKDYTLAAGLMTPTGRAKIAPAFDADTKADRNYNPGLFKDAVEQAVGKADRCAVTKTDRNGGATVRLALTGGGAARELTLTLVKGPKPGLWLVDAFDTN